MRFLISVPLSTMVLALVPMTMSSMPVTTNAQEKPSPATASIDVAQAYQERSYTDASGATHRYRVLLPENFDAPSDQNKKYPVVLFLHGAGERGDDNRAQLKHVAGEFARPDRRKEYPRLSLCPSAQPVNGGSKSTGASQKVKVSFRRQHHQPWKWHSVSLSRGLTRDARI